MNMCMHCLEEGKWTDEDKCPKCAQEGHISPWQVSKCPACNKEYNDKMHKLIEDIGIRSKDIPSIPTLEARIKELEASDQELRQQIKKLRKDLQDLDTRLTSTGMERIGIHS